MADEKVTQLAELAAPADTDIMYVVDDPGGAPVSNKVEAENLARVMTKTSTYAARTAAAADGKLFLPSDGAYLERDTGAAWAPWGPVFPFTVPVNGDFAWINQDGASVDQTYGGIYFYKPGGGGVSVAVRKKAAPAAPYTVTAIFETALPLVQYAYVGLVWRQSSDGKLVTFAIQTDNNQLNLGVTRWTDPTTWSASYVATSWLNNRLFMLRLEDNNTNRICSFSVNGQDWIQFHSIGRTDFLTADEVGICIEAAHATYSAQMNLLSWVEA